MNAFVCDLRYAGRQLCTNPGFAALVILTVAVGLPQSTRFSESSKRFSSGRSSFRARIRALVISQPNAALSFRPVVPLKGVRALAEPDLLEGVAATDT